MIDRKISSYISKISGQFRVIGVLGPRQSGKTTLARLLFPHHEYVNFERQSIMDEAKRDINNFMLAHPPPVIFDEVQCFPAVLNEIQCWVDEHPEQKAAYVITGSNQPHLRGVVSESLAGRIGLAYLLPLSFDEIRDIARLDRAGSVVKGFLPESFNAPMDIQDVYDNYLTTYVNRDVNQLINLRNTERFTTLVRLLAARVGQLLNYQSLAEELGVTVATIQDWITVMEASFVVFRIYPYYRNFGKRFVKTPKIYFTDVGLAAYLLGLRTAEEVVRNALFGQLFENMVVANIRKNRFNAGEHHGGTANMYFLRDKTGCEVDLVLEESYDRLDLIEIKSSMSFNADYAKSIEKYAKIIGSDFHSGKVIYAGTRAGYHDIEYVPFAET